MHRVPASLDRAGKDLGELLKVKTDNTEQDGLANGLLTLCPISDLTQEGVCHLKETQ